MAAPLTSRPSGVAVQCITSRFSRAIRCRKKGRKRGDSPYAGSKRQKTDGGFHRPFLSRPKRLRRYKKGFAVGPVSALPCTVRGNRDCALAGLGTPHFTKGLLNVGVAAVIGRRQRCCHRHRWRLCLTSACPAPRAPRRRPPGCPSSSGSSGSRSPKCSSGGRS